MFVNDIEISNYRLYGAEGVFRVNGFNVPNGTAGSGLNVVIGENGCGKTSLLEAIALPLLEYKAEAFNLDDINDIGSKTSIRIGSSKPFTVKKTMPRGEFKAQGSSSKAGSGLARILLIWHPSALATDNSSPRTPMTRNRVARIYEFR